MVNDKPEYIPGENITCVAEGYPYPDIYWMNDVTGDYIGGPVLTITTDMKGYQAYTCVASNEIRGQSYNASISHTFRVGLSGKSNDVAKALQMSINEISNSNWHGLRINIHDAVCFLRIFPEAILVTFITLCENKLSMIKS